MNKTTAKELLAAVKEHVAVQEEETKMKKLYPSGTCNAEDAWCDFGERERKSFDNLRRLAKCRA